MKREWVQGVPYHGVSPVPTRVCVNLDGSFATTVKPGFIHSLFPRRRRALERRVQLASRLWNGTTLRTRLQGGLVLRDTKLFRRPED
jgi:hypothetical protein